MKDKMWNCVKRVFQFHMLLTFLLLPMNNYICECASFNEAFAASIQTRLEGMLNGPGIRVLNPLEVAFSSQ
jgi:hypothetical protein